MLKVLSVLLAVLSLASCATQSARVSGPTIGYTLDAAGNRESVDNNGTPAAYTLAASMNQYTQTPFDTDILHDDLGSLTSQGTRAKVYTYDSRDRLTGWLVAAPRTVEAFDGTLGAEYDALLGAWGVVDGSLKQSDAATAGGRIVRAFAAGATRFAFSYKTTHDPENENTYDPAYYALALLRVDDAASPEWRYVALVIQPNGLYLREWVDDALTGYAAADDLVTNPEIRTEANTWYDVEVRYGADWIEVFRAKRGNPFPETATLTLTDLTVVAGSQVGFGVGTGTDFAFDNLITTTGAGSATDILQTTFQYDALGRRIAKNEFTNGVPDGSIYYYYDGQRVIEERDGASGAVEATYVYGNYVDEVLQMQRDTNTDTIPEDYYYHTDDLYNVMAITDSDNTGEIVAERYDYADYGKPSISDAYDAPLTASAIGNPHLFNGQRYDTDLGLYHYRARYMDPNTGRFVQRDPIGLWGDAGNLGNGYAYAGNNPWTMVDPYGLNFFTGLISEPFNYLVGGPEPYGSINPEKLKRYLNPEAPKSDDVLGGAFGRTLPRSNNSAYAPETGNQLGTAFEETLDEAKDWAVISGTLAPGGAGVVIAGAGAALDVGEGDYKGAAITGGGALLYGGLKRIGGGIEPVQKGAAAEKRVAEEIGIATNSGKGRVTLPGSGPGGIRIPDFPPEVTIRTRGSIIEVKDVKGLHITPQLRDLADQAERLGVKLEIFTNAPAPLRGELRRLIRAEVVKVLPLP